MPQTMTAALHSALTPTFVCQRMAECRQASCTRYWLAACGDACGDKVRVLLSLATIVKKHAHSWLNLTWRSRGSEAGVAMWMGALATTKAKLCNGGWLLFG